MTIGMPPRAYFRVLIVIAPATCSRKCRRFDVHTLPCWAVFSLGGCVQGPGLGLHGLGLRSWGWGCVVASWLCSCMLAVIRLEMKYCECDVVQW